MVRPGDMGNGTYERLISNLDRADPIFSSVVRLPRLRSLRTTGRCSSVSFARYTNTAAARTNLAGALILLDLASRHARGERPRETPLLDQRRRLNGAGMVNGFRHG